jgi:hypothetical protein
MLKELTNTVLIVKPTVTTIVAITGSNTRTNYGRGILSVVMIILFRRVTGTISHGSVLPILNPKNPSRIIFNSTSKNSSTGGSTDRWG